ncbi:MAG: hypothetical protein WKG07_06530 [Hymenobacter sp.]
MVRDVFVGHEAAPQAGAGAVRDAPLLLLDEPTTNLDAAGAAWYQEHVQATRAGRTAAAQLATCRPNTLFATSSYW